MSNEKSDPLIKFLVWSAVLNTIVVTPFFNKDGMIIPKMFVMFCTSLFVLPIIIKNFKDFLKSWFLKSLLAVNVFLIFHSVIVLTLSSAPLEQQIFGRTGRGLGLLTIFSLLSVLLITAIIIDFSKLRYILLGLILSASVSSLYSVLQSYGHDLLQWESRTNGVIGTLGNPNFQSAFAAMALTPSLLYFSSKFKGIMLGLFFTIFFIFVIYRTQSTQGMIAGAFSFLSVLLAYFWYRSKAIFLGISFFSLVGAVFTISGMLNNGPLAVYLYKGSVISRGDFWRSAFSTANSNPIFGVGLDSFGDNFLKYRDEIAANHESKEYTDNAHNFFLEQAATGGYPMAILNLALVVLVLASFINVFRKLNRFEPKLIGLFSSWLAFQMTTVISPGNLVTMYWNSIISGALIGLTNFKILYNNEVSKSRSIKTSHFISFILSIAGFMFLIPLFNTDRIQLLGMQKGDANLVMKATTQFPESTVRYNLIGGELLTSGLTQQSLEIARSGVEFNRNSAALWALILVNPNAPLDERLYAKNKVLELDPLNVEVKNYNP
jgi:O-antigen ligase